VFDALREKTGGESAGVHEHVDVAVSMGFERELIVSGEREAAFGVGDGGNELLFDDVDLFFFESEVLIGFEGGDGFIVGVAGGHDDEWNESGNGHPRFDGENALGVVRNVGGVFGDLDGNVGFDVGVAEAFAQSARDHDECGFRGVRDSGGFVTVVGIVEMGEIHNGGLFGNKTFERVFAFLRFGEKFPSIGNVADDSAGIGVVDAG